MAPPLAARTDPLESPSDLFGTEATINIRVGNFMLKLGPRDRVQAAVVAHEHGIAVARDRGPTMGEQPRCWDSERLDPTT